MYGPPPSYSDVLKGYCQLQSVGGGKGVAVVTCHSLICRNFSEAKFSISENHKAQAGNLNCANKAWKSFNIQFWYF